MGSEIMLLSRVGAVMLLVAAMAGSAHAGCSCCARDGDWTSGLSFIGASAEAVSVAEKNYASETAGEAESIDQSSMITAEELAEDLESGQSLVMAYVGVPGDASFIEGDGSIQLPLAQVFNEDGSLKSTSEIAVLFGAAGITEGDTIVIYGDNLVYETFAFWVLKYLGHENVFILEGPREDREAAGLKFVADPTPRAAAVYNPSPNLDLLAGDDDLVGSQLVDARGAAEYNAGHMAGAVNIDSSTVMGPDNWFADDQTLDQVFSGLDEGQRVVVISSKGGQASMVLYPLRQRGYDVSLYFLGSQA